MMNNIKYTDNKYTLTIKFEPDCLVDPAHFNLEIFFTETEDTNEFLETISPNWYYAITEINNDTGLIELNKDGTVILYSLILNYQNMNEFIHNIKQYIKHHNNAVIGNSYFYFLTKNLNFTKTYETGETITGNEDVLIEQSLFSGSTEELLGRINQKYNLNLDGRTEI